jgi:Ser/Thr protein kinase RdoA (MazF antagonist)
MDKQIKARYSDAILHEAMQRFGIGPADIWLLDGFESFIYEFRRNGGDYILRVGHSGRRPTALIRGEVDWINYLADGGASVARAVLSARGELVEALDDGHGGDFLATAFEKAPGVDPWKTERGPAYYRAYGSLLGRMHALSKGYQPRHPEARRPQWDDPLVLDVEANLPPSERLALEKFQALAARARALPQGRDDYGLIHFDAHEVNLLVDKNGRITLFDFDDCHYNWYANDLAIVLFYSVMGAEDPAAFTQAFMRHFIDGYTQENAFNPAWLALIPDFMKMREIDLYAVIHRSFDVENLDDPWCARFMDGRKRRIEGEVPVIEMDFEELEVYL